MPTVLPAPVSLPAINAFAAPSKAKVLQADSAPQSFASTLQRVDSSSHGAGAATPAPEQASENPSAAVSLSDSQVDQTHQEPSIDAPPASLAANEQEASVADDAPPETAASDPTASGLVQGVVPTTSAGVAPSSVMVDAMPVELVVTNQPNADARVQSVQVQPQPATGNQPTPIAVELASLQEVGAVKPPAQSAAVEHLPSQTAATTIQLITTPAGASNSAAPQTIETAPRSAVLEPQFTSRMPDAAGARSTSSVGSPNQAIAHASTVASDNAAEPKFALPQASGANQTASPAAAQLTVAVQAKESATPARARAAEVEIAVKLENATGQTAQNETTMASVRPTATATNLGSAFQHVLAQSGATTTLSSQGSDMAADEAQVPPAVLRGLSAMVNQRGGIMTMRLDPPELGQLRVQMMLARGVVTAEFQVTTSQAHAMLEKNLGTLRLALESQGLHVDRLVVHHTLAGNQQSLRDDAGTGPNQSQRQQHDAANGESRGRQDQPQQQEHESRSRYDAADFAKLMSLSQAGSDLSALLAGSR